MCIQVSTASVVLESVIILGRLSLGPSPIRPVCEPSARNSPAVVRECVCQPAELTDCCSNTSKQPSLFILKTDPCPIVNGIDRQKLSSTLHCLNYGPSHPHIQVASCVWCICNMPPKWLVQRRFLGTHHK